MSECVLIDQPATYKARRNQLLRLAFALILIGKRVSPFLAQGTQQ